MRPAGGERWGRIHRTPPRWERETVKDGEATKVRTSIPKTRIAIHATEADDRTDRRPWYHAAEGIDKVYPYEPWWGPRLPLPVRTTAHGRKRALSWAQHRPKRKPENPEGRGVRQNKLGLQDRAGSDTRPPPRQRQDGNVPSCLWSDSLQALARESLSARQPDGRQDKADPLSTKRRFVNGGGRAHSGMGALCSSQRNGIQSRGVP